MPDFISQGAHGGWDEKNALLVKSKLDDLMQQSESATALHESLMPFIPTEEQQRQNQWFSKVNKHTAGCIKDVEAWFKITDTPVLETHLPERSQHEASVEKETHEGVEKEMHEDVGKGKALQFHQNPQNEDQDEIAPFDSISNQGSSKYGTKSNVSSTSSAHLRAEADVAALLARLRLLKEKHALEEQEEQIRKRKEQLQLEAEIAASVAKVNVLRRSGSNVMNAASKKLDVMEYYFINFHSIFMQSLLYHLKLERMEEDHLKYRL